MATAILTPPTTPSTFFSDKPTPLGRAYLVGAGPGNPELITLRGWRLLRQADVILYDRLIPDELLADARPEAELIFVGKRPGYQALTQNETNALLVQRVLEGRQVVRLKGGDPFVFGRGGEEALALATLGLPFEIVPGISSATAVPAFAGIPVTHRGLSTGFAVITGHEDPTKPEMMNQWQAFAHVPTLVLLMATRNLRGIAHQLEAAGRDPDTPAAAIQWGTTAGQRTVTGTLATLADNMAAARLTNPAVIVIGQVAALHRELAWFVPQRQTA